jgi:nicotinamide-nucleotide amidase
MHSATILSVGDELVLGQTIDTNSAWLSRQLASVGIDIAGHLTVPDSRPQIAAAIRHCADACDLLIISGGLGPTEDDLTREALADAMGTDLVRDDAALATLRGFFERLGRTMPLRNEVQAFVPRGARAVPNSCGTAPGLAATLGNCRIAVMPGVPKEMKAMWDLSFLPELRQFGGGAAVLSRTLHTFGLGESTIAEKLGDLMNRSRNPSVGTTVSGGIVSLRLNARADNPDTARRELDETTRACHEKLGLLIFGQDDESLAHVIARMLRAETRGGQPLSLTTAESCTGGQLAKTLTDIPGSSAYFRQGYVAYHNDAKTALLGVDPDLISRHGAVSEAVASAMARGALKSANADIALSITGIAGPDGGTPTKPVGTVYIGLAWNSPTHEAVATSRAFAFPGDREMIRDRSVKMALSLTRFHLLKEHCPF